MLKLPLRPLLRRPPLPLRWTHRYVSGPGVPFNFNRDALHLYRHLIREARVLHDDFARSYICDYIRQRFRTKRNLKLYRWDDVIDWQTRRKKKALKNTVDEAEKGLKRLRKANSGEHKALMKVLMTAYGRLGKRKHDLMRAIVEAEAPPREELIAGVRRSTPPPMPPPLAALIKHHNLAVEPKLPATNIWQRPFPKNREANMRWKHHIKVVGEVQPPLPLDELRRLARLAQGLQDPIPPRRKKPLDSQQKCRMGPREWRRAWQHVLDRVPVLEYDEETGKWATHKAPAPQLLAATPSMLPDLDAAPVA